MHLSEVDQERLHDVCERFGVARLQVFGSTARGDARADRDIDILYSLRPGVRLGWEIEDLVTELSEIFGRQVDLVAQRGIHERLRESVLADAKDLYAA